jgi:putative heme transporter
VARKPQADEPTGIDPTSLAGVFATPGWLRDLGGTSWLFVGIALLIAATIALLSFTAVIVTPVITASVIAAVAGPLVGWLRRHHVPRVAGAALVLLGIVGLGGLVVFLIVAGIGSQASSLANQLDEAKATISGWLQDAGVDAKSATDATKKASSSTTDSVKSLLDGLVHVGSALASLVFFLAMVALSLFFLLLDGPTIRAWGERQLRVPPAVAHTMVRRVLESLRGYFLGVTIVAAFNAAVVGLGAWILGVPLAATIMLVTFLGAYVPYLGAWGAGALSVLVALGGAGTEAAAGMIVVQLLANSVLQQLVQPIAYGAALGIHPLAVLIVTIAGGALFGAVGLILAAPVTSAVTRISVDLRRAREAAAAPAGPTPTPEPT